MQAANKISVKTPHAIPGAHKKWQHHSEKYLSVIVTMIIPNLHDEFGIGLFMNMELRIFFLMYSASRLWYVGQILFKKKFNNVMLCLSLLVHDG